MNQPRTIITYTDGYKLDHRRQYPDGTEYVYSNFTPRSGRNPEDTHVVFFGLQAFLIRRLGIDFDKFFAADIDEVGDDYRDFVNRYLGPNKIGTIHIRALHKLGYLPLEFRALPEGTEVPYGVPMFTHVNTKPEFFWLTNYVETVLSTEMWHPCTSATSSARLRRSLNRAAEATGSDPEFVSFQGHDFSMRGLPGVDAAAASGAAHLLSFVGTDTLPAIDYIQMYYPPKNDDPDYMIAVSVPATEHSVMCAGGEDNEFDTFERLLTEIYPEGILSVVSDSWDLWEVLTDFLPRLHDVIMGRDGKLVIRPDSGDPADILCGDPDAPEGTPERAGVIQLLWDEFGGTETATGHKMLDGHIGAIYGDSITNERAINICERLAANGFASGNVVFGIGSFTMQYVTRDTHGFAMKATYAVVNGVGRELFKNPKTDRTKKSACGLLAVREVDGELVLFDRQTPEQMEDSLLVPVWRDGEFLVEAGFDEVRARLGLQQ